MYQFIAIKMYTYTYILATGAVLVARLWLQALQLCNYAYNFRKKVPESQNVLYNISLYHDVPVAIY